MIAFFSSSALTACTPVVLVKVALIVTASAGMMNFPSVTTTATSKVTPLTAIAPSSKPSLGVTVTVISSPAAAVALSVFTVPFSIPSAMSLGAYTSPMPSMSTIL